MNKLTASRCRLRINELRFTENNHGLSNQGYDYLEALEIALPVLEQQERGEEGDIISTPQYVLDEKWKSHFGLNQQPPAKPQDSRGEWIEWGGGKQPLPSGTPVEVKFRSGATNREDTAGGWSWECTPEDPRHWDIIAYRVVEQERDRGEEE